MCFFSSTSFADIDFMLNLIGFWNSGQPQTRTVYLFGVGQQRARRDKYKKSARHKMSRITLLGQVYVML